MDGRVAVHGVQFETGSTAIRQGSEDTMKAVAEMMAELPELKIAVVGHTDPTFPPPKISGFESYGHPWAMKAADLPMIRLKYAE